MNTRSITRFCIVLLCISLMPLGTALSQIYFGDVQLTRYRDSSATQYNPYPFSITVTSTVMKNNPSDFSIIAGGAPFTIPPGGSHSVTIRFRPSQLGLRIDTLVISGSFVGSPILVELSGTGIPLPVELQSYSVRMTPDGALIQWNTASETNNIGFYIQRMLSIKDDFVNYEGVFDDIGFVEGAGTTHEARQYRFLDRSVIALITAENDRHAWYRILQMDADGSHTRFPAMHLEPDPSLGDSPFSISASPNPFRDLFTLRWQAREDAPREIRIVDQLGRTILDIPHMADAGDGATSRYGSTSISRNHFPAPGAYFIICRSQHHTTVLPIRHFK